MITRDYHGFTLENALMDLSFMVGTIRQKRDRKDVTLITGHGIIQIKVMEELQMYGLSPKIQLGNSGVVICEIE